MPEVIRTPADCAACLVLRICDAHITGGSWPHRKGINPCRVELGPEPISDLDWHLIYLENEYERLK